MQHPHPALAHIRSISKQDPISEKQSFVEEKREKFTAERQACLKSYSVWNFKSTGIKKPTNKLLTKNYAYSVFDWYYYCLIKHIIKYALYINLIQNLPHLRGHE